MASRTGSNDLVRSPGVWRAIGELRNYKLKDALWPEAIFAVAIGTGGTFLVVGETLPAERIAVMGDVLALAGVLLAVTFAALALVVSIPSGEYLRMLAETEDGGMRRFLDPFLVAVGIQIGLILLIFSYRIFGDAVPKWVEHTAFGVAIGLAVFTLFDVAGLARQLARHGILRAAEASLTAERDAAGGGGKVERLRGRGGNR